MELVVLGDDERNQAMTSPRAHDLDEGVSGYFAIPEKSGTIDTDELNEMFEPTTTDDDADTGNFHLGSHHFSASGVKYFSSNCQACKDIVAAIHNGKNSEGKNLARIRLWSGLALAICLKLTRPSMCSAARQRRASIAAPTVPVWARPTHAPSIPRPEASPSSRPVAPPCFVGILAKRITTTRT